MNELSPQENLRQVLIEFENDLQFLQSQQVLTNFDVQKLRNQADVSKNAMLTARDEPSFTDKAKDKLLNALIRDFEKSIQRTVDEAVGRKGDKALLIYKLNKVDKKINLRSHDLKISQNELKELATGMNLLKLYIIRSLPEKNGLWGTSKVDIGQLVNNYEQTIFDYIQNHSLPQKIMG